MARGGFHGGGFHSGGHHGGGGGFHGGGFSGGGFHGGYHGGYYGGGHNGGDHYSNSDAISNLVIRSAFIVIMIFIYVVVEVQEGAFQGLNLINLAVYSASAIILALGLKQYGRMSALKTLKRNSKPNGKVWKGEQPIDRTGDRYTWAGKYEKKYCISFSDTEFGTENAVKVKETMDRTPKILWINPFVWLVISVVSFFNTFWFYEMFIPFFENSIMTDQAFAFIDEFIFYLPSGVSFISAAACLISVFVKDNLLYKCAIRIAEDNKAAEERLKTEEFITSTLSKKWYHNFCPNCGAAANPVIRSCSYCGASLEVKNFSGGVPAAVHRIPAASETEDKKKTAAEKAEKEKGQ
ncbi:MAG: hypothetical protein IKF09_00140 [Clostridiales bacterium]|nr:hypothetical protein [Clostridiales bacterium]